MIRKHSYGFETPAYSYAQVEAALGVVLAVRAEHRRGPLRARLKHLQRLGLVDLKSGKGKRVEYSHAQVAQWLLALILAEMGLDPVIVVTAIKSHWKQIAGDIERATSWDARSGGAHAYLCLWPRAMSATWEQKPAVSINVLFLNSPSPMPTAHNQLMEMVNANRDNWFCAYNLTRALSRLETALPPRG